MRSELLPHGSLQLSKPWDLSERLENLLLSSFPRDCMTLIRSSDVSYWRGVAVIENHPLKICLRWLFLMSGHLSSWWGKWKNKMNSFVSVDLPMRNLALFVFLCCCLGKSKILCPFQFPLSSLRCPVHFSESVSSRQCSSVLTLGRCLPAYRGLWVLFNIRSLHNQTSSLSVRNQMTNSGPL